MVGIVTAIATAGMAKQWVFGWIYREMVADRDFWRDRALRGSGLAEIATDVAEEQLP